MRQNTPMPQTSQPIKTAPVFAPGGGHIARHRENATANYGGDHGRDQMRHRKTIGVVDQVSTPLGKVSHDKPAFCTFIPLAPTSPCQRTSTEYSHFSQINSLQRIIFLLFLPVLAHFHANHLFIMHLYDIYDSSTKRSDRFLPSDESSARNEQGRFRP
ncbi:hypothetical protein [Slackia piriformis]|uniref:hypothetical protein n=1 Tax=Slackia piriformis TaxID=626934 RepID=UPI0026DCBB0C|nr:hypothetical protein [Slackia piriformis]MDO5023531.1 hypothetical protein [Slackia piriformis]